MPPVPEAEKAALRGALVEGLAGARGSDLVARQVAIALAKVARCDWPAQWPDLFEAFVARLNQALAAGRPEAALRLLRGLHHALKELASKRLAADKRSFHALAGQLLPVLQGAWVGAAQEVAGLAEGLAAPGAAAAAQAGAAGAVEQLRRALQALLFCTKGLGRLLVYGHEPDARTGARVEAVVELLPQLFQAVVMLQPLAASPHLPGHEVAGRIQTKVLKIAVDVVEHHPWSFGTGPVLAPVLDFCEGLVRNEAGQFPEALIIQSMHLLHAVLKCGAYRSAPTSDLDGAAFTARLGWFREAAQVLQGFFSAAKVVALDDLVVHKYLRLSPEELEDWAAAAEAFHHACDTGGHKERARPSAETLHVALVEAKPDVLGPHLVQAFDAACAECPGEACNGAAEVEGRLLAKAALYSAVALVENDLHDSFDLVGFLHSQLAVEFRGKSGPGRIVRRQGLLLVAAWVGKVSKAADRELLYGLVLELLADADAAVRLAACACLRALVDDWNFREEPFERFQAAALERLVAFLRQAETCDTKLQVRRSVPSPRPLPMPPGSLGPHPARGPSERACRPADSSFLIILRRAGLQPGRPHHLADGHPNRAVLRGARQRAAGGVAGERRGDPAAHPGGGGHAAARHGPGARQRPGVRVPAPATAVRGGPTGPRGGSHVRGRPDAVGGRPAPRPGRSRGGPGLLPLPRHARPGLHRAPPPRHADPPEPRVPRRGPAAPGPRPAPRGAAGAREWTMRFPGKPAPAGPRPGVGTDLKPRVGETRWWTR